MATDQSIGSFEAKTHLSSLLDRVARGERFTITKHGKPVAMLVPVDPAVTPNIGQVVSEMLAYRDQQNRTLDGITMRELVEEGRR